MNAISNVSNVSSISAPAGVLMNVRATKFDWVIVAQVCICVIPAMATIDMTMPVAGARYLAGMLFCFLAYYGIKGDRFRFMALLFGCGPAMSLMRGLFFYNSIVVFLCVGFGLWAFVAWSEVKFLWEDPLWRSFAVLAVAYWFIAFLLTTSWINNIRVIEFVLAAGCTCLLARRRSYLATAFVGMAISVSAYAIAMLPYGVRLGEGDLDDGTTIGNPILVGMPSALIVILSLSDRGRYLMMETKIVGRMILLLTAAQWLMFSGSRGSWLVTLTCLALVFIFNQESRKPLLVCVAILIAVSAVVILSTDRGDKTAVIFGKSVDSNRTLVNRTSGRSEMWAVLPQVFAQSPVWGWGPGRGADVDKMFTGRHLLFHSMYLQVIAETGLVGSIPLLILLLCVVHRDIKHLQRFREVTPLLGITGFLLLAVSVTAFDLLSGILLGLALMPRESAPRFAAREMYAEMSTMEAPVVS